MHAFILLSPLFLYFTRIHMRNIRKLPFTVLLGAGAVLILLIGLAAQASSAALSPLSVDCGRTLRGNAVTWIAMVAGGIPPYSYLWVGDQVSGSRSAEVTATYAAPGAKMATLVVVDSDFNSLAATCAASISLPPPAPAVGSSSLQITAVVDNGTPHESDTIHYTVSVTNLGPATSSAATVKDILPSGLLFATSTPSRGVYYASSGIWQVGDLGASSTVTLELQATVASGTAGRAITNVTTAGAASSSVTLHISGVPAITSTVPLAGLGIQMRVDNPMPHPSDTILFTIAASGYGPATSTGVQLWDGLPAGLTFLSASPSRGSYASTTNTLSIGELGGGQDALLYIRARVNATATPGEEIWNTATVAEDSSTLNLNTAASSSSVKITVTAR